jgi:glycosyltransferase involved in cell wall biosynthesis
MRVLQIHARYRERGGEDRVVAAEAEVLRDAGHEVSLLESQNAERTPRAAAQLAASLWNPISGRRAAREIEDLEPDIVHVHNTWFSLSPAVVAAASRAGIPVVATLHNYRLVCSNGLLFRDGHHCEDCVGSHPWHGVRHRCYRDSYPASLIAAGNIAVQRRLGTWARDADRLLVLSEFARSRLRAAGLPEEKLIVKPNFVSEGPARGGPPSAGSAVVYVGRLSSEKGILPLLEAWSRATKGELELRVIGDGPLWEKALALAGERVRFLGRLPPEDVREELASARALVIPSFSEGQPLALLEALAARLPVVGSDIGGLSEILARLGPEFLIRAGDIAQWSGALSRLRDDATVDRVGEIARSIYEERFTPRTGLAELERAYRLA